MKTVIDLQLEYLLAAMTLALAAAAASGFVLARTMVTEPYREVVAHFNERVRSWWWMAGIFVIATLIGGDGSIVLFGLLSFFALREYITATQTRFADHHTLFWCFFIITPLQYLLVALGKPVLFTVAIPVYAFLLVPLRSVIGGDTRHFLERVAKIQWGLMLCVYCVSHAPALLTLSIKGYEGQNAKLLLFMVAVDETSDVIQSAWGRLAGGKPIAPAVSKDRTWRGAEIGIGAGVLLGTLLWWATPFSPWQAAAMSLAICLMGSAGSLTMAAIKQDRGVRHYGNVLDRIDSLCFAAPIFFHLTRYFFT